MDSYTVTLGHYAWILARDADDWVRGGGVTRNACMMLADPGLRAIMTTGAVHPNNLPELRELGFPIEAKDA